MASIANLFLFAHIDTNEVLFQSDAIDHHQYMSSLHYLRLLFIFRHTRPLGVSLPNLTVFSDLFFTVCLSSPGHRLPPLSFT